MSGHGRVYSWTTIHRTVDPVWQVLTPFVAAIVEIDEQPGVLIPGLLTGIASDAVSAGLPAEIWFEEVTPEITLHRWRPAVR